MTTIPITAARPGLVSHDLVLRPSASAHRIVVIGTLLRSGLQPVEGDVEGRRLHVGGAHRPEWVQGLGFRQRRTFNRAATRTCRGVPMGPRSGRSTERPPARPEDSTAPRILVLGALAVRHDGAELQVAGTHRRRLLALLASAPGRAVSVDAIVDALWGDNSPPTAAKTVQSHMARLRRSLEDLGGRPDHHRSRRLPARPRADRHRRRSLRAARPTRLTGCSPMAPPERPSPSWWKRSRCGEVPRTSSSRMPSSRPSNGCASTSSERGPGRTSARCGCSSATSATRSRSSNGWPATTPAGERVWALLMRALYADGRQQEALDVGGRARTALLEGFGLEPGPALAAVERQILVPGPRASHRWRSASRPRFVPTPPSSAATPRWPPSCRRGEPPVTGVDSSDWSWARSTAAGLD